MRSGLLESQRALLNRAAARIVSTATRRAPSLQTPKSMPPTPLDRILALAAALPEFQPPERHLHRSTDWASLTTLFARLQQLEYPCLVADHAYGAQIVDRGSDSLLQRQAWGLYLLERALPAEDSEATHARASTRALADRLLAAIVAECRATRGHPPDQPATSPLARVELDSLRIAPLGPVADFAYGIAIDFTTLGPYRP